MAGSLESFVAEAITTARGAGATGLLVADLINGPLAHLPSGRFAASAAWLTCTCAAT